MPPQILSPTHIKSLPQVPAPDALEDTGGQSIIQSEKEWRQAPRAPLLPDGAPAQISASRWVGTINSEALEVSTDGSGGFHVVSTTLRNTKIHFSLRGRTIANGSVLPGETLLTGPSLSRARAVYREDYDIVRLYVPQTALAESIKHLTGRNAPDRVELFEHHETHDPVIHRLVMSVVNFAEDSGPLASTFLDSVGLTLATHLVSKYIAIGQLGRAQKASPLPRWKLNRVFDYVDENLSRDIFLAELSAVAGLSRMHFAAQFRAATGMSPHSYILHKRVSVSKQMLTSPILSVQQVANSVGFKTQSHFINVFRRIVGETPARWRQRVR